MKVSGILDVREMLLRLDNVGKRRVVSALYRAAHDTANIAREMAPVDLGNLEAAIKVRPERLERVRDAFGRFTRTEVEVYIDMDMPVEDPHRKEPATVGQYAYHIHEHLAPYGYMQLGKKSRAKQARSRYVVGGGFLERAAEEIEAELEVRLKNVLDGLEF